MWMQNSFYTAGISKGLNSLDPRDTIIDGKPRLTAHMMCLSLKSIGRMNGFVARKDITHALGMKDEINADTISKFDFLQNIVSFVRIAPNAPAQNKEYVH